MVAVINSGVVMNKGDPTENQKNKLEKSYENISSWSLYEEDNIEIRKRLEAQKGDPNKVYPFMEKSETEKQIVDQKHQYWRAVYVRLNEGLVNKGDCDGSFDTVEGILFSLPGADVGGTLDFYMSNGGYCDCEVLLNVYSDESKLKKSGF
jgi:hypothetical protein